VHIWVEVQVLLLFTLFFERYCSLLFIIWFAAENKSYTAEHAMLGNSPLKISSH